MPPKGDSKLIFLLFNLTIKPDVGGTTDSKSALRSAGTFQSLVIDVKENQVNLYKNIFLPDLERQTMAIIGCVQPYGAVCPVAELQCRAAVRVFKREAFVPRRTKMWRDIQAKHAFNAKRYVASRRHTIQVEIIPYMDQLAELAGCSVRLCHLIRTDPVLALKIIFGPFTPYQFRLYGPLKWLGARDAIQGQWKRVYSPLKTKPLPAVTDSVSASVLRVIFIVIVLLLLRFLFIW
ncbi:dimethylaniline monooxygenase [n-oxide-forming] [Plakobranchus ocellatus]|uniref:Flavin-containing monooxygenase n=1 Tax=Plakobranchus ocellatus TaxID=259542 RepID=A0AAV4DWK2_9GAST|nr:dimethylaniline monooxygenase [n-oxide-forming] [Plakobranchus ocellatus]